MASWQTWRKLTFGREVASREDNRYSWITLIVSTKFESIHFWFESEFLSVRAKNHWQRGESRLYEPHLFI